MERRAVEIEAGGVHLRGWLYPGCRPGPAPAVVMAPGFAGVKEQLLDRYAEVFAAAGLAVLVFDHRSFGASDGEPRQEVDPWRQVEDYRHVLAFAASLPEIDSTRLGVWGTSLSGGHALAVAAIDRRVRCAVAQLPMVSGTAVWRRRMRPEVQTLLEEDFALDRQRRLEGHPPAMVRLTNPRPGAPCAMPGRRAWEFFEALRSRAPAWRNEVTLRSLDLTRTYEPGARLAGVGTPALLVIAARDDDDSPTILEAYSRAAAPKELLLLPGGHFDIYSVGFERAARAARDWLARHLGPAAPAQPT